MFNVTKFLESHLCGKFELEGRSKLPLTPFGEQLIELPSSLPRADFR